jgi:hypothetical protein
VEGPVQRHSGLAVQRRAVAPWAVRHNLPVAVLLLIGCSSETASSGATSGAGGGDTSGAGGGEAAASSSSGPALEGCDVFANWNCVVAESLHQCYASCDDPDGTHRVIACDGRETCDDTSVSTRVCEAYAPEEREGCGDCEAAFNTGCDGRPR